MEYDEVKAILLRHWSHTGGSNEHLASELYHDDALLEFPQSGERFRGRAKITSWRSAYPARLQFEPRAIRGAGDVWIAEGSIRYDEGEPMHFVKIVFFRSGLVERETIYIAAAFAPAESRSAFADETDIEATPGLPLLIEGGSRGKT